MIHTPDTEPFVLEVPILEDAAVNALHTFLLDLLTQFENHYFDQLHRYQQDLVDLLRGELEERHASSISASSNAADDDDIDLNDQIPF